MPLLALAVFVAAGRAGSAGPMWGALAGVLVWALLLVATTEVLSLACAIEPTWLAVVWVAATVAGLVVRRARTPAADSGSTVPIGEGVAARSAALGIAVILAGTLVTALLAAPNSWDSMTYHLSRVEHWAQNRSIAHYPTGISRQLHSMPFSEMVMLHARVLSGGDRLANLAAWLAFAGCVWVAAALGLHFGGRRAAVGAAQFAATLPMGVIQASSTLNDLPTAFFLLAAAALVFRRTDGVPGRMQSVLVGGALGLALLTKGTAYLYAPAIGLAFAFRSRHAGLRGAALSLLVAAAVAALLNAGHWQRNASRFGTPLVAGGTAVPAAELGGRAFASNVLRGAGSALATPSSRVNGMIERGVAGAHRLLGISPTQPATTFSAEPFRLRVRVLYENFASYPFHLLLAVAAFGWVAVRRRNNPADLVQYTAVVLAGAMLFTLLVRWQPWITRLQLPALMLAGPVVGVAVARWPPKAVTALGGALLAVGLLATVANETRPLLPEPVHRRLLALSAAPGRTAPEPVWRAPLASQLFAAEPEWAEPYQRVASWLAERGAEQVGVVAGENAWEYPLWALLRARGRTGVVIRHVCVRDQTGEPRPWRADAVVVLDLERPDTLRCGGTEYRLAVRESMLATYLPAPVSAAGGPHAPGGAHLGDRAPAASAALPRPALRECRRRSRPSHPRRPCARPYSATSPSS
jgi:hypothetical protein